MRAMVLREHALLHENPTPLILSDVPVPRPGHGEVLVRVAACGVCHTELDEIEGRLRPPSLPRIVGHEIVGIVVEHGSATTHCTTGTRVGVGWIHHADGSPHENLSPAFSSTGCDVDGGYAEYIAVPEDYVYPIPDIYEDAEAAPLLCAGAIGYRALRLTMLKNGQHLGLTGFGGSAHLVLQLARYQFPDSHVYVFARDAEVRRFAEHLGAVWTGNTDQKPPVLLDAIIDTTPAWRPVVKALGCLRPGGRLVINAIRKEAGDQSELLALSYHDHLWMEKEIKTVANITQYDIRAFLPLAAAIPIRPTVETYPLEEANRALTELRAGKIRGAKVLVP
ncbi:MAG: zinc-dependent alcohol dehydrogenase family protein [Pirellulaceae bacterium]|nr:zinc-dependent alcohol dehydrogenase family protein [Planctomycetales bacterium]